MTDMEHIETPAEYKYKFLQFEVEGDIPKDCKDYISIATDMLEQKLHPEILERFGQVKIRMTPNIVEGGGQALIKQNLVLLNYDKMKMTLQESEDHLSGIGIVDEGDRTKVMPKHKDAPWSTLIYELIHELGHFVDDGSANTFDSPTKYGSKASNETFAETFTYWVAGATLEDNTMKSFEEKFGK
jgi:hypothetical protein